MAKMDLAEFVKEADPDKTREAYAKLPLSEGFAEYERLKDARSALASASGNVEVKISALSMALRAGAPDLFGFGGGSGGKRTRKSGGKRASASAAVDPATKDKVLGGTPPKSGEPLSRGEIATAVKVTPEEATDALMELEREDKVKRTGKGKGTKWSRK